MTFEVSQANRDLFAREGYMILPGVIPANYLTLLREGVFLLSGLHGCPDGRRARG
jgi:hypothetical protein